jgi:hydroxymethylbilane synthase
LKFIVGTRGSQLSLAQTKWVISELKKTTPESDFEIKTIKTKGDTDARPLFIVNQKGIFEKEIDNAVLEKKIDFAVHSLKDIPSELQSGLALCCVPKRAMINDVFISNDGSTLNSIKPGAVIGTSSLRRAVQISRIRPDLIVKPIRGNVESRIKKIYTGNYDAIVLAEAGITRLDLDVKFSRLSNIDFPPSPGQGALGIVCRDNDSKTIQLLKKIENEDSRAEIEAERAFSLFVESGCRFPIGAFARAVNNSLNLTVVAYSVDGKESIMVEKQGCKSSPKKLGQLCGRELDNKGINKFALNWRQKVEEWNQK